MTFPNALAGIKKIYTAKILSLIVTGLALFSLLIIVLVLKINPMTVSTTSTAELELTIGTGGTATLALLGVLTLIVSIVAIVASIMEMVGLYRAGKDERLFHLAFLISIIVLVVSVFVGFFTTTGENATAQQVARATTIKNISEVVGGIAGMAVQVLSILGIKKLAENLQDEEVAAKAAGTLRIVLGIMVLSQVVSILSMVLNTNDNSAATLLGILTALASIMELVAIVLYLALLKRTLPMLQNK